jgi:hypothetical protein
MVATNYKTSRDMQVPLGCNRNQLDQIHDPKAKHGGAATRQILDVRLFR